jgi:hypothetical protein
MLAKGSGGGISDRCGNFVEGGEATDDPVRDAAPTEAGAVPGTSLPSDHACIFNVLAQANLDRNFPSGMGDRRVGT